MKIIEIKQNSREWVKWRGKGIGASEAPIIMEDSPWTTPFELWCQKTGLAKREEPNVYQLKAMERGHDLEPVARIAFEEFYRAKFPPMCVEHDEYPFLRASFDGYNKDEGFGIEIKAPSVADHQAAIKGKVPAKYEAQVQMQMLISGAPHWTYVSYHPDSPHPLACVSVAADKPYHANLLETLIEFWNRIETKNPPKVEAEQLMDVCVKVISQLNALESSKKLLELTVKAMK